MTCPSPPTIWVRDGVKVCVGMRLRVGVVVRVRVRVAARIKGKIKVSGRVNVRVRVADCNMCMVLKMYRIRNL